jgi:hypothetical protein
MFATCQKGHDLTAENAYLYTASGLRECRLCAIDHGKGKPKRKIRFELGAKWTS